MQLAGTTRRSSCARLLSTRHTALGRPPGGGVEIVVLRNSLVCDVRGRRQVPLLDVLPEVGGILRPACGGPARVMIGRAGVRMAQAQRRACEARKPPPTYVPRPSTHLS